MVIKRLALIVAMFFIPALAKADNIVQVDMQPYTFDLARGSLNGTETMGANFVWDVTTGVLSDFVVSATGPFYGVPILPTGGLVWNDRIILINFNDSLLSSNTQQRGDQFQLDYFIRGNFIGSAPGVYTTDLYFHCAGCYSDEFAEGSATVTEVSTPEPSSLLLLTVGIVALGLAISRRVAFA